VKPHATLGLIRLVMHVRTRRRIVHRACRAVTRLAFAVQVCVCMQDAWCDRTGGCGRSRYVVILRMTHAAYGCHRKNTLGRIRERSVQTRTRLFIA
jgi:hypothetical protein